MSGGSSVYSPLPQSNSDSDEFSEEELHSSNERQRVISRISKLQTQTKPEVILNSKKPKVTNYKQLDNDRDIGITLNGFQLGTDEITILKPNTKIEKFSTSRKICFAFSIFLCVFTTVAFLWILPCEIGSCPPALSSAVPSSWKKIFFDKELHGPISVVPNGRDKNQNLIFLFRDSFSGGTDKTQAPSEVGGVVSLLGGTRKVSWWTFLKREPKDIDCNIIDVDRDGVNDCLVVGTNNLFKAIQSLSGIELWDMHGSSDLESKSCDVDFPIALPDLDEDHTTDLLTVCSVGITHGEGLTYPENYFVLVSGRTGSIIGSPLEISHCYSIRNFMLEKEYLVSYTCSDLDNKESVRTMPLRDILMEVEASVQKKVHLNQIGFEGAQHRTTAEGNKFYVKGRRLSLENHGRCPDNCTMFVTIKDERSEKSSQSLWTMKRSSSYGMIPVTMKFGKLSGFVFKYWHWESEKEASDLVKTKNETFADGSLVTVKQRIRRLNDPKSLEDELFSCDLPESVRCKRMLARRFPNGRKHLEGSVFKEGNFTFNQIIERVVLITFNETYSQFVNASQTEITQICSSAVNCQPDVNFQRHSLLITDLDNDNFQELVSYSSSFVKRTDQDSNLKDNRWQLQSTVQVIRLEDELPKLYDNIKNQ